MSNDPCSYTNANATKAGCIASGGKPNLNDPCSVLNPTASPSGCTAAKAASSISSGGTPTWALVVGIIALLLLAGIGYGYMRLNSPTVMGGRRRGFSLKRILGL